MHVPRRLARLAVLPVVTAVAVGLLAPVGAGAAPKQDNVTLRLGYFPNVTHASAIVGVEGGIFQEKLGNNVKLETSTFNAGPQAVEALNSGALDATYIGPNPAINAFAQSGGEAIRIISGATSGGAFLVVKPSIKNAKDLKGKKIASPQLGQHPGRRPAHVAEEEGPQDRPRRRRRRLDPAPGQRADPRPVQARRARRRVGPRAVGDASGAGGWGQGPRRREHAVAEGPVRDDPAHRPHRVPQGPPRRREAAPRGPGRGERPHQERPREGAGPRRPGHQQRNRQAARRRRDRGVVQEPHVHERPDRHVAAQVGQGRRVGGAARRPSTSRASTTSSS